MRPPWRASTPRAAAALLGLAIAFACAGPSPRAPDAAPARAEREAGPRELGLEGDPTGAWERAMGRFDAAQYRRDSAQAREDLLEATALALAFDALDVRVDRTQAAIDLALGAELQSGGADAALALVREIETAAARAKAARHPVALHALERRGRLHFQAGDAREAIAALGTFVAASREGAAPDALNVVEARVALARALAAEARLGEATSHARGALETRGVRPESSPGIEARAVLGGVAILEGRRREGIAMLEEARELARGAGSHLLFLGLEVALGGERMMEGDLVSAQAAYQEVEAGLRLLPGSEGLLSLATNGLGAVAALRGDLARAVSLERRAIELAEAAKGAPAYASVSPRVALAQSLRAAGELDEARALVARARALLDEQAERIPALHGVHLEASVALAEARLGLEREAVRHAREALRAGSQLLGERSPLVIYARGVLAFALAEAGLGREAVREAERTLERVEEQFGAGGVVAAAALETLAAARIADGDAASALAALDRAQPILERHYGARSPSLVDLLERRAEALRLAGRGDEAERDARRVASLREDYRRSLDAERPAGAVEVARRKSEPELEYASSRFGYRVKLAGWIPWKDLESDQPNAEFGALHPSGGVLVVIPVSLLGTGVQERLALSALLSMLELEWPASPKGFASGDLRGIEAAFERSHEGETYAVRARVLKGGDSAYAILCMVNEALGDRVPELLAALDAVELPAREAPRVEPGSFSAAEERRHAALMNEIGLAHENLGSRGEAIRFLEKAHELLPGDLVIVQNLAFVQIEAGRYGDALELLEGEPGRFADRIELLGYRAIARSRSGDPAGAIRDYEAAFALGLEDDDYTAELVELIWQSGEHEKALARLDAAIAAGGSAALRARRASLRSQAGRHAEAIEELEALAAQGAADASVYGELVLAYQEAGRHRDAIEATRRSEQVFGRSHDLLVQRASSEYELGLHREAMASLDAALALEPGSPLAKELASVVAATLGEGDRSLLREALEPVAFPPELVADASLDPASLAEAGGGYDYWVEAIRDAPGQPRSRTVHLRGRVADSRGADVLSSLRFEFHPLWEAIWLNDLVVRDASGKVTARRDAAKVYVADDSEEDGIATSGKVLHVAIPGLHAGSSFEIAVTRRDHREAEHFQFVRRVFSMTLPVAVSALVVSGDLERLREWRTPGVERVPTRGGSTWIARTPPTFRWEPMQSGSLDHLPRVLLGDERDSWASLSKDYLGELAPFLGPAAAVSAAAGDASSGSTPREKALRAAAWVQETLGYKALLFGVRARIPNHAEQVLGNRFGDCKDHSLLLYQILAQAGLSPRLALVSFSDPVEPSVPSLDQFDHMIVSCEACGVAGFLDATDKDLDPASVVPRGLAGHHALILDPEEPRLVRIPSDSAQRHTIALDRQVALAPDGGVRVTETAVLSGHWGASLRGELRAAERSQWKEILQRQIFDAIPGSQLLGLEASHVDEPSQPLELRLEYGLRGRFSASGTRLIGKIPAVLEATYLRASPDDARESPFEIRFPLHLTSRARLEVPQGFAIHEAALEGGSRPGSKHLEFEGSLRSGADGARVTFSATRFPGRFPASDYPGYFEESEVAASFFDHPVELERE